MAKIDAESDRENLTSVSHDPFLYSAATLRRIEPTISPTHQNFHENMIRLNLGRDRRVFYLEHRLVRIFRLLGGDALPVHLLSVDGTRDLRHENE